MHSIVDLVPSSFTEIQRRSVVSRLRSGETVSQVSKELDLHPKHIHAICALEKRREQEEIVKAEIEQELKEKVVEQMTQKFKKERNKFDFAQINQEYEAGANLTELAKRHGFKRAALHEWRTYQKMKGANIKAMRSGPRDKAYKTSAAPMPSRKAAKMRLPIEAAKTPPPVIHHSRMSIDKYENEMRRLWIENMNLRIELMKYQ